ncbi:MAG: KH domain-containing protein [Bacteroidetes bacterium]|nr:KH domain-containing protein [Bacteroidota bacterium]
MEKHKKPILIGKNGEMIKQLGIESRDRYRKIPR